MVFISILETSDYHQAYFYLRSISFWPWHSATRCYLVTCDDFASFGPQRQTLITSSAHCMWPFSTWQELRMWPHPRLVARELVLKIWITAEGPVIRPELSYGGDFTTIPRRRSGGGSVKHFCSPLAREEEVEIDKVGMNKKGKIRSGSLRRKMWWALYYTALRSSALWRQM